MYYPFFRGKQFELLAIRESSELIGSAGFNPIIEPVRETFTGLQRTLLSLVNHSASSSVIVNPRHGDHRHGGENISAYLEDTFGDDTSVSPAVLLTSEMSLRDAFERIDYYKGRSLTLVHAGFIDGRGLSAGLPAGVHTHVFLDARNTLYRRPFRGETRILVEDGFVRSKNADYGYVDRFSDLHVTYEELGGDGYGDFLTIGDHYAEGGGPAYAVAIHLTYIDPEQDDAMFVFHFVSDSNDTPVDPAGKFAQALSKLVAEVNRPDSFVRETSAVIELRDLYRRGHFPGLGYVKKLSIKHHLETLAAFHANE